MRCDKEDPAGINVTNENLVAATLVVACTPVSKDRRKTMPLLHPQTQLDSLHSEFIEGQATPPEGWQAFIYRPKIRIFRSSRRIYPSLASLTGTEDMDRGMS